MRSVLFTSAFKHRHFLALMKSDDSWSLTAFAADLQEAPTSGDRTSVALVNNLFARVAKTRPTLHALIYKFTNQTLLAEEYRQHHDVDKCRKWESQRRAEKIRSQPLFRFTLSRDDIGIIIAPIDRPISTEASCCGMSVEQADRTGCWNQTGKPIGTVLLVLRDVNGWPFVLA
jgi:hypothetical protein